MTSEMLFAVSATITALGVISAAVIAIYRIARRIGDALGVDSNGRTIADRLDRVEHQLWENGGSSLADRVNNIEKHVVKVSTEIEFIKNVTVGLKKTSSEIAQVVEPLTKPTTKPRAIRSEKAS